MIRNHVLRLSLAIRASTHVIYNQVIGFIKIPVVTPLTYSVASTNLNYDFYKNLLLCTRIFKITNFVDNKFLLTSSNKYYSLQYL